MATESDDSLPFAEEDCASLVSQISDEEKRIRLKRRWLLGLDTTESEIHTESEFLPESLLREDDVFPETVKLRVEKAFGVQKAVRQKKPGFSLKDVVRHLDSLTTTGLFLTAFIVSGGSDSFDKTRWKMKQFIRESINKDFGNRKDDVVKQLNKVLSHPGNFHKDRMMTPPLESHRDAAIILLDELDGLSTQTLVAMKRKLKGLTTQPRLQISRCHLSRADLIQQVRQESEKMLSDCFAGNNLPESLAKALSLVDLSRKLTPCYETSAATEIFLFSPETKKLHDEIVKAIWILCKKVSLRKLKKLRLLLDPDAEVSNDSLRTAVRNMLTEYLYECSDMNDIPESLTKALSLVNRSTQDVEHMVNPREAIQKETECILNVSAQVKQILCESIPDYELDQEFADAYMEDLQDSEDDDDDADDDHDAVDSDHEEGGAECSVLDLTASSSAANHPYSNSSVGRVVIKDLTESIRRARPGTSNVRAESETDVVMEVDNPFSARSLHTADDRGAHSRNKNQYLAVQEISDDTSLFAHNLIGRLLEKFADQQGPGLEENKRGHLRGEQKPQEDTEVSEEKEASSSGKKSDESIVVSAVTELMPSVKNSVLMKLKEIMKTS